MLGGPSLKGRIAQKQFAAFANPSRSISSFRPQLSRFPVQHGKSLSGHTIWKPVVPSIGVAARFNSTTSVPPLNNSEIVPNTQESAGWDLRDLDVTAIPERIGYLKDLGLDYGWGPSSIVEYVMEHLHIWGGLPWLASIGATGLLIRFALMPLFLRAADTGAKIANSKDITSPIRAKMMEAARAGDQIETQRAKAELSKIQKEFGIKPSRAFLPLLAQVPLGYGCYRVISGMAHLPVPGLAAEKFLWINDFTVSDPYFLLPALTSFFLYMSLKKGGEMGTMDPSLMAMRKVMMYGMPSIQFVFMAFFPAAVQFYFLSTGLFGLAQAYLLASTSFRNFAGVALIQSPNSAQLPSSGGTPISESRSLRLLTEELERENAKMKAELNIPKNEQKISFIDRAINSIKESKDTLRKEASQKLQEIRGGGPKQNADGTLAGPPRLSEQDRQLAEAYEKRRNEEEAYKREERNHARREAHLKAMEKQRENARNALKKNPKVKQ